MNDRYFFQHKFAEMLTHYETLGVKESASLEVIRKAFFRIQLKNHPDKTGDLPEYERTRREAISKAANEAWEVLSDESAKGEYDQSLQWVHSKPKPKPAGFYPAARPRAPPPGSRMPTNFTAYAHFDTDTPTPGSDYNPDILFYNDNGWSFEMKTSPRCRSIETWEADANRVWENTDGVVIMTKLGNVPMFPGQNDVTISITSTPFSRKISEIRSCFRKSTKDGEKETVLFVSIITSNTTHGDTLPKWEFAWNAIPANITTKIPEEAQNWAVYLTFHVKEPETETPWQYLKHFEELQPVVQVELEKLEYTKMAYGLDRDMRYVHRLAAAAYMAF